MNEEALEIAKKGMRLVRDAMITKTDWAVLPDSSLSEEELNLYKLYRKYLRDLPNTMSDSDFMTFKGIPTFNEWKSL
jgi:hypothetical protein